MYETCMLKNKHMKAEGRLFGKRRGTNGRWREGTREGNVEGEYDQSILYSCMTMS
jgi:hypothetical protein